MKYVTLPGTRGVKMPMVGLGTWKTQPEEIQGAVLSAMDAGYRHIDTAFNYNNEEAIGDALRKWIGAGKGKREDLFITTKLPHVGNRASDVEKFLNLSLERLKLDYVDLYLIHMPFSFLCDTSNYTPRKNEDGTVMLDCSNNNIDTWKEMERLVEEGKIRSIGLSNFNIEQVMEIHRHSVIKPAVLQVEMHAYLQQSALLNACKELDVIVTAYSPLGSPGIKNHFQNKYDYQVSNTPDLLGHPLVKDLALKYNRTPGQVLLRHLIQKGVAVIPKSSNILRIKENMNIFDFEVIDTDVEHLNELDKNEEGRILDFLFFKGVEKHPQYPFSR